MARLASPPYDTHLRVAMTWVGQSRGGGVGAGHPWLTPCKLVVVIAVWGDGATLCSHLLPVPQTPPTAITRTANHFCHSLSTPVTSLYSVLSFSFYLFIEYLIKCRKLMQFFFLSFSFFSLFFSLLLTCVSGSEYVFWTTFQLLTFNWHQCKVNCSVCTCVRALQRLLGIE